MYLKQFVLHLFSTENYKEKETDSGDERSNRKYCNRFDLVYMYIYI